MSNSYPVEWQGHVFPLGDLTVGVKKAYCAWLRRARTAEAIADIVGRPDVLSAHLSELPGLIWWGDGGCSPAVHSSLKSHDGGRTLNRLLFGESAKVLSDADLDALVDAKEAEQAKADKAAAALGHAPPFPPANDYMAAMLAIKDAANPKA